MTAVILVIHILLAIGLTVTILLQRSEGGALGMGGGPGGLMSGRAAGDVLTRSTSILGAAFFATSILLAAMAGTGTERSVAEGRDLDAVVILPDDAAPTEQPFRIPTDE